MSTVILNFNVIFKLKNKYLEDALNNKEKMFMLVPKLITI